MNGIAELEQFKDWIFLTVKSFYAGIYNYGHLITYFICFAPIIRLVFKFIKRLMSAGKE